MPNSNDIVDAVSIPDPRRQTSHITKRYGDSKSPEQAAAKIDRAYPANASYRRNLLVDGDNGAANVMGNRSTVTHSPYRPPRSSTRRDGSAAGGSFQSLMPRKDPTENALLNGDFWKSSFSSLSALASAALGSDTSAMDKRSNNITRPTTTTTTTASATRSRHLRSNSRPRSISRKKQPSEWGPQGPTSDNAPALKISGDNYKTSQERKREALLAQSVSMNGESVPDTKGNFKRRSSDEYTRPTSPTQAMRTRRPSQTDSSPDALVYIHHVRPTDTLTGVSIRYGCDMSVLRKSNGFWPSDSIQMRQVVLLPVEACTVKGTRVEDQDTRGNEEEEYGERDAKFHSHIEVTTGLSSANTDVGTSSRKGHSSEPTWKHEYYIKANGFASLIEVGRVPRQALGFFPRARRKTQPTRPSEDQDRAIAASRHNRYDTLDHAVEASCNPSPSRTSPSSSSKASPQDSIGSDNSLPNPPLRKGHHRRQSTLILSGPGGVGTLEPKGAAVPGPAEDQLNKFMRSHFPGLARPPDLTSSQRQPASTSPAGLALEDVGSAIESWVKKMATKAKSGFDEAQLSLRQSSGSSGGSGSSDGYGPPRGRSNYRSPAAGFGLPRMFSSDGGARDGFGDLIEMNERSSSSHKGRARNRLAPHQHQEESIARTTSGARIPEGGPLAPRRRGAPKHDGLDD